MLFFLTLYSSTNPGEKKIYQFQQKYEAVQLHEQQISILEWFLKNHVILKTGVMMLKIQLCNQRLNYILKYIKIENSYFKL